MQVKAVVTLAVEHIRELFEHEELTNVGLEEVDFEPQSQEWIVTVGFSRPWDYPTKSNLSELAGKTPLPKRSFKRVRVDDLTGDVLSVKNWSTSDDHF